MRYKIEVRKSAEKALRNMDQKNRQYVYQKLLELADNPQGLKCEKLRGFDNGYRKVAWPYHILYTIDDTKKIVDVYKIAHRKEGYR